MPVRTVVTRAVHPITVRRLTQGVYRAISSSRVVGPGTPSEHVGHFVLGREAVRKATAIDGWPACRRIRRHRSGSCCGRTPCPAGGARSSDLAGADRRQRCRRPYGAAGRTGAGGCRFAGLRLRPGRRRAECLGRSRQASSGRHRAAPGAGRRCRGRSGGNRASRRSGRLAGGSARGARRVASVRTGQTAPRALTMAQAPGRPRSLAAAAPA